MTRKIAFAALIAALAGSTAMAQDMGAPMDGEGPGFGMMLGAMGPGVDFATLDADGDGLLTPEELQGAAAARFAAADLNADGGLSPDEIVTFIEQARAARIAARVTEGVDRADDNADGLLQAGELAARMPPVTPLFDRADDDGDGAISAEEFAALQDQGMGRRHGGHGGPGGWGFFGGHRHGG